MSESRAASLSPQGRRGGHVADVLLTSRVIVDDDRCRDAEPLGDTNVMLAAPPVYYEIEPSFTTTCLYGVSGHRSCGDYLAVR